MSRLDTIKTTVKRLSTNSLEQAFRELERLLSPKSHLFDSFVLLQGQFNKSREEFLLGIVSHEQVSQIRTRITAALLQLTGNLSDSDLISEKEIASPSTEKRGELLYNVPHTMQVMREEKCIVRIAWTETALYQDWRRHADDIRRQNLRIAEIMGVELLNISEDAPFSIRTLYTTVQLLDSEDHTEWVFYVKPLKVGDYQLAIRVSMIEMRDNREVKRELVLEEKVNVSTEVIPVSHEFTRGSIAYFETGGSAISAPNPFSIRQGAGTLLVFLLVGAAALFVLWKSGNDFVLNDPPQLKNSIPETPFIDTNSELVQIDTAQPSQKWHRKNNHLKKRNIYNNREELTNYNQNKISNLPPTTDSSKINKLLQARQFDDYVGIGKYFGNNSLKDGNQSGIDFYVRNPRRLSITNNEIKGIGFLNLTDSKRQFDKLLSNNIKLFDNDNEDKVTYGLGINENLIFNTGSGPLGDRITISESGRVGIGATNPTATLHVNRDFRVRQFLNSKDSGQKETLNNSRLAVGNSFEIPQGYQLAVDGGILATEVLVKLDNVWADYVFEKDYYLMPIDSIQQFIQKNKHLPGIPTATEVGNSGLDLSVLQQNQLETIEELYLHMIALQKKIDQLQKENEKLKSTIPPINHEKNTDLKHKEGFFNHFLDWLCFWK